MFTLLQVPLLFLDQIYSLDTSYCYDDFKDILRLGIDRFGQSSSVQEILGN